MANIRLTYIIDDTNHENDTDEWAADYTASVAKTLEYAELLFDASPGDDSVIRRWREGDDENDNVFGIEWDVRAPGEHVGTAFEKGVLSDYQGHRLLGNIDAFTRVLAGAWDIAGRAADAAATKRDEAAHTGQHSRCGECAEYRAGEAHYETRDEA